MLTAVIILGCLCAAQLFLLMCAVAWSVREKFRLEQAEHRVMELEDILCPYNQHEWTMIEDSVVESFTGSNPVVDFAHRRKYMCSTCKKVKEEVRPS